MHTYVGVLHQLEKLGVRHGRIFKGEIMALTKLMLDDEVIEQYMTGRYEGGLAILVATNRRLLLVDKKPFNLTVEDIPYDMISEVEYTVQAFNATITVHSISKTINMMSFRQSLLRRFAGFVQARVMHIRAVKGGQMSQNPVQQIAQQGQTAAPGYHTPNKPAPGLQMNSNYHGYPSPPTRQ